MVINKKINIVDTPFSSEIIQDFLNTNKLDGFFSYKNEIKNYEYLINKRLMFSIEKRKLLYDVISEQYKYIPELDSVFESIKKLKNKNTFTITTGHQLCLNTGPLYFIYKILQTIKISKELKKRYPKKNFIPIYWMASEDHDFEEIKSFETKNNKFQIETKNTGFCTGRVKPLSTNEVLKDLDKNFQNKNFKNEIIDLFNKSYNSKTNLAESTRTLVHSLFKDYGLIVFDADNQKFKATFKEIMIDEVKNFSTHKEVSNTVSKLKNHYINKIKVQVNPRKLNLFYLNKNIRYRLSYSGDKYNVVGTKISFTKDEIIELINEKPHLFSPNVLLRPIYQETLLPNLSYIGGSAEISYWLQLKSLFNHHDISFPILVLRNSFLILNRRDYNTINKYNLNIEDFFCSKNSLIKKIVDKNVVSDTNIDKQINELKSIFKSLLKTTNQIDENLKSTVESSKLKQIKILELLKKKIIKSKKRKISLIITSLEKIHEKIYPKNVFQERKINFSEYYSFMGEILFNNIYESIQPFDNSLIVTEI